MELLQASYILPLKAHDEHGAAELCAYVNALPVHEVIVVDGSEGPLFSIIAALLDDRVVHVPPAPDIAGRNGKVRNVLTGLRIAKHERVIVADDDVRYDARTVAAVLHELSCADVVRPQNYFDPLPWHAVLDTGRTLLNRALDGDWPGTLAFRKSMLPRGYNADVLFENFELVRTIRARGGRERVARSIYVRRLPPSSGHFWSQRVRQAYDEFARPARLCCALSLLPLLALCAGGGFWRIAAAVPAAVMAAAAWGLLRDGGYRYFSPIAIAAAPLWVLERSVCAWLALYQRVRFGGVRYAGGILRDAASPAKELKRWAA